MLKIKRDSVSAAFRNNFREISHPYPTGISQINIVEGNILSNQAIFVVSSWGLRLWNWLLNQEQKNMAYINGFRNSAKISLLYLENEIIYFWFWGKSIEGKNSGKKLRIKILYVMYYLIHTAWEVTLSPTDLFGKCVKPVAFCVVDHIC